MNQNMKIPKVGDVVYVLYAGRGGKLEPETVSKVGRKYFTLNKGWREVKFYLESWSEVCDYGSGAHAYASEQEYNDRLERDNLLTILRKVFTAWGDSPLNLQQLRAIRDIIEGTK